MPMSEETIATEAITEDQFVEPNEEIEVETETEEIEAIEEEATTEEPEDFSGADKAFLDRFEIQFDKGPKKFDTLEALKEAAEMGSALPRYKEKVSKYESNPAYKYIDNYMKESGYSDPAEFVHDIQVNSKVQELMKDVEGMTEEKAKALAEQIVGKPVVDAKGKEIEGFLKWHNDKVESGKFDAPLDAENIPQQVLDAHENGQSLKEAYMDYVLDDIKFKTEQDTIKKIAKNKETSAGKLKDGTPDKTTDMTKDQINTLLAGMSAKQQSKWLDTNWKVVEKSGYFG